MYPINTDDIWNNINISLISRVSRVLRLFCNYYGPFFLSFYHFFKLYNFSYINYKIVISKICENFLTKIRKFEFSKSFGNDIIISKLRNIFSGVKEGGKFEENK